MTVENKFLVKRKLIPGYSDRPEETWIKIDNPVYGPISPDDAMAYAAWLIVSAAPFSKLKIAKLVKAIEDQCKSQLHNRAKHSR